MELGVKDISYIKKSKLIGFIFMTDDPDEKRKKPEDRGGHFLHIWDYNGFDPTEFNSIYGRYQSGHIGDGYIDEDGCLSMEAIQFVLRLVKSRISKAIIPNTLRFDILKRDNFTCQYCGGKPPEVTLEIDHIIPRSEGGETKLDNLITSCRKCNSGKRNKKLQ